MDDYQLKDVFVQDDQHTTYLDVLDHGYVMLDDVFRTDRDVARIARNSTGKGNKSEEEDRRFLDYLWRHEHMSPFEMPVMCFEIKMPIFVARQWVRHRTASMNEFSGRYSEMPEEMYSPEATRFQHEPSDNRQGSQGAVLDEVAQQFRARMQLGQQTSRWAYEEFLADGASKEVARINLPLSQYTVFHWQQNLRNLLHLLRLRLDEHAQWETRQYAKAIYSMVQEHFPWTCEAFERWTLHAETFGSDELDVLRGLIAADPELGERIRMASHGMRASHRREFYRKLYVREAS